MKRRIKLLSLILCVVIFASFGLFCACSKTERYWSKYFDLSDEKKTWEEEVDEYTLHDCISVILKKQIVPIELTIKDFDNSKVVSLEYTHFEPDPNRLDDKEYMENFRQDLILNFKEITLDELVDVIHAVERLVFVKAIRTWRVIYD